MQRELNLVSQELQKEKARANDIEMEQQNPINIHRWRLLKGKDPGMHELLQKLETFQELLKKKSKVIADKVRTNYNFSVLNSLHVDHLSFYLIYDKVQSLQCKKPRSCRIIGEAKRNFAARFDLSSFVS